MKKKRPPPMTPKQKMFVEMITQADAYYGKAARLIAEANAEYRVGDVLRVFNWPESSSVVVIVREIFVERKLEVPMVGYLGDLRDKPGWQRMFVESEVMSRVRPAKKPKSRKAVNEADAQAT